jgi:hypothetical protein
VTEKRLSNLFLSRPWSESFEAIWQQLSHVTFGPAGLHCFPEINFIHSYNIECGIAKKIDGELQ